MSPRNRRYKLLLDEMLPRRTKYPLLNCFHDVRHIVHDYKKSGSRDDEVLRLAAKEGRILITKNVKHFRPVGIEYGVDIIGVTETIQPEELDKTIMAKLKKRGRASMSGRFTSIVRAPRKQR